MTFRTYPHAADGCEMPPRAEESLRLRQSTAGAPLVRKQASEALEEPTLGQAEAVRGGCNVEARVATPVGFGGSRWLGLYLMGETTVGAEEAFAL